MAISFTTDQQKVIDARHTNVLVSAAAGSGKTAVLVERIVQLVCVPENNIDIDELLVVTFTKAAAAEMRERILKRIGEELELNPGSAHLQKQYALVHRAMITTIDSFCQNVLRNHFQDIDLDPDFRVMDEGEMRLMRQDVITEMLEEKYKEATPEFLAAVDFFTSDSTGDEQIEKYILELQSYSESFARPMRFLEERMDDHVDTMAKLKDSPLGDFMVRFVRGSIEGIVKSYEEAVKVIHEPDGPYMYGELIENEYEQAVKISEAESIAEIGELIERFISSKGRLDGKRDASVNADKREAVKNIRTDNVKQIEAMYDGFFSPSIEVLAMQCDACADPVRTLVKLTMEFRSRLQEMKRDKKVVDFGDMEHYALEILTTEDGEPTPAALEYRNHFKEIMVDEYQDSNLIQDIILDAIARKEQGDYDRFMVGDVKQSIYGFRQARPDLFLDKYDRYPTEEGCVRIDLSKNFRSRAEVLDSVNDVFDRIMHRETGKVEYDESARLNVGAVYPAADAEANYNYETELILIDSKLNEQLSENMDGTVTKSDSEALVIADKIAELMATMKVTQVKKVNGEEVKSLRPLKYSDIVVLHRSPSGMADTISKVFEMKGIPVSIGQGKGYFSVPEVQQVLQLIRSIDNPLRDIPLFGALHSIFGGFSSEEIATMRAGNPEGSLYDAVKSAAPEFIESLDRYRKMSMYMTIRELLQRIFDDYSYLDYVMALPGGKKRRANVEKLLSYASDFEKTSYFGLHHFVRYIDLLDKYTEDNSGEADVLGENADVVRFMSVHKSKGLEFPVTIIAGMGHKFMDKDQSANLNHDNELGIGCRYVDLATRVKTKTLRNNLIAKKMREDSRAEEMRLLYVAMTRAKEKLIMIGSVNKAEEVLEKRLSNPEDCLSYSEFIGTGCPLDYILPVVANCRINTSVFISDDLAFGDIEEQTVLDTRRAELNRSGSRADAAAVAQIRDRFAYEYPYKYLEKLNTKTTVSELKMAAMLGEDENAAEIFHAREKAVYEPEFRRAEKKPSGTDVGDCYHRIMEIMDYDFVLGYVCGGRPSNYAEFCSKADAAAVRSRLEEFLALMVDEHRVVENWSELARIGKLVDFMRSEICFRLWQSNSCGKLKREQPFVLSVSAKLLNADYPESEKVIIQGIIDVFFEENGKMILLDYKTDSVKSGEELVTRYSTQMDYYQEAIEKLTGKQVAERILYSFSLGETIRCEKKNLY
ncbi:MAG: helicase-exonuclease AddAB subunit AddA [Lachnospiraceae bacterium]|nr:helicase-exonuclease AddAB subunit AddA [Lachnospiraceae bacterium]